MKFALAALALSAVSQATPVNNDKRGLIHVGIGGKGWKGEGIPFHFTSIYNVEATPDQVVDAENKFTGGLADSYGIFKYGINSHEDIICYNITLFGFRGDFQSPASTATHIHEAEKGKSGPPRIAFPNPVGDETRRSSIGCLKGPFRTGVVTNGKDSGEGFTVKQIEENPSKFFTDSHSSLAVPGAFRGQLNSSKC